MRRIRYSLLILALLCLLPSVPASAADDRAARTHRERVAYARDFAQSVINILHDPKRPYGDRKSILRRAFADSVDIDWIAKFALGRAWKEASDRQRERYTALYRTFLTETYVSDFAENHTKTIYAIKIIGVNDEENNEFVVRTHMSLMNQSNLNVDYRVSEKDGHYRVHDIIIENISLATTHRAEFSALASAQGVDGVINTLARRVGEQQAVTLSMK